MKTTFISLLLVAANQCLLLGAEESPVPPEMTAALANARAYEQAYAKGDAPALAAFFTEDADYTSDDGREFSGRAAIEAVLRDAFRINKGA